MPRTTPQEETMTASATQYRELDFRAADGVEVGLFWNTDTDRLVVVVDDARSGDLFELEVSAAEATDAFEHPYAYAAHRGVEYAAGLRTPVYA
jgi:hypothetical protein